MESDDLGLELQQKYANPDQRAGEKVSKLKALLRYEFTDAVRSPVAPERVKISLDALTLRSELYARTLWPITAGIVIGASPKSSFWYSFCSKAPASLSLMVATFVSLRADGAESFWSSPPRLPAVVAAKVPAPRFPAAVPAIPPAAPVAPVVALLRALIREFINPLPRCAVLFEVFGKAEPVTPTPKPVPIPRPAVGAGIRLGLEVRTPEAGGRELAFPEDGRGGILHAGVSPGVRPAPREPAGRLP